MGKYTRDSFVENAIKKHGNKYDYSKVDFVNIYTKVCITCHEKDKHGHEHGEFWQTPKAHLRGDGCPGCAGCKRLTTEEFIRKSREVHGGKYDYSKVEYKNNHTKVRVICHERDEDGNEHGEFWIKPNHHMNGHGCAKCAGLGKSDTKAFIKKAMKIHGDKYDYAKVEYLNNKTKVCITCPKHGEFWQTPNAHLRGDGCRKCRAEELSERLTKNIGDFVKEANTKHDNKYGYDKVLYTGNKDKVIITCPIHGDFRQTPNAHLMGHGCPQCANEATSKCLRDTRDAFIGKARLVHGDKYSYGRVNYVDSKTHVLITCQKHGDYSQPPSDHIQGKGCPRCGQMMSKAEDEIAELLKGINTEKRNHTILGNREIDIYVPSLKLGIEYNGLIWHSEKFGKDSHYHIDKLNRCNEQGARLIQIFEDEWVNHREICESKLKQICGLNDNPKVYARKCAVREICNHEAEEFLNTNHIQGFAVATIYLGAFYGSQLVGAMTFKREKDGYWELNRFATDIGYQCIGVGGKMFRHFTRNYDFVEVKSFADRRWTASPTDNLYTKLGFRLVEYEKPDYRYFKDGDTERHHKFGFRKQILHRKYGLPLTMTESEMTRELGYTRIWDCGLIKYIYRK